MNQQSDEPSLDQLVEYVDFLSRPEDAAVRLLWKDPAAPSTNDGKVTQVLKKACASLFQEIESISRHLLSLSAPVDHGTASITPLSGLSELYIGPTAGDDDDDDDETAVVDAETIWGQVELQNSNLYKLLRQSVKQINRAEASDVQLMDDIGHSGDDASHDSRGESDLIVDDNDEVEDAEEVDDENSDDNVDEETKRIRERMDKAMQDMDTENDEFSDDDSDSGEPDETENDNTNESGDGPLESLDDDPDAANLHDGFFNLQEMEAFADEEEDFLPEEAFGTVRPEDNTKPPKDKKSFHQKQRDGDLDSVDSEMDDDDDDNDERKPSDLLFEKAKPTVFRKKYRADDEIDALYSLYKPQASINEEDEDDDDSMTDAINMTAADIFGKPNRKYYDKWNAKSKDEKTFDKAKDDDSWNEFDFNQHDDEKTAWNRDDDDGDDDDDDARSGNSQEVDEVLPMKDKDAAKSQSDAPTKHNVKLLAQTEQLEREMLAEKPWQMKGEAGSTSRPLNSLLDATPEFEIASKVAPIITVERTADLEEVIKKRILAEDWDDVIPRELPDIGWNKKKGELPEVSQEKSKLGLGELYEREYLKKAVGHDVEAAAKQTEEEKAKTHMKAIFANLCSKLDALSNYHFAPRPIANDVTEVRAITVPAIAMEEVLPIHVSDARGVAPEEVYGAKRGRDAVLREETELSQLDRKRIRGSKKATRRKARKDKLADEKLISRLQPGIGLNNPYEKRKIREELSMARAGGRVTEGVADKNDAYGASTTFFQRMQQEAQQTIRDEATGSEDKKRAPRVGGKSSAYKL